jgi:hypothetical protein
LEFRPYLIFWIAITAVVVFWSWFGSQRLAGLILGYLLQLWMFYWIPAFMHANPASELPRSDLTYAGFQQATYALAAVVAGTVFLGPILRRLTMPAPGQQFMADPDLPKAYIIAGIVSFAILMPTIGRLPSLNALTAVGQQLVVVGLCLASWKAWQEGGLPRLLRLMSKLWLLPVVTVLSLGFLGYGVLAASIVFVFTAQFFRPRALLIAATLVMGYAGLSFYVAYIRTRDEIRKAVWGGESTGARIQALRKTFEAIEPFRWTKPEHAEAVDNRLNQAYLVGAAVVYLTSTEAFAGGATIREAFTGLIPRVIWPDKPGVAGSSGWASRLTGMEFAEGTSVGLGQILEFYGNYGTMGVVIGMFLFGGIIAALDAGAGARLAAGNWQGFAGQFLVGLAFLNAGGSLFEVISGAAASVVAISVTNGLLIRYQKRAGAWRGASEGPGEAAGRPRSVIIPNP